MAKVDHILLKSKFRGSMLGSLFGDCFGAPFEGDQFTAGMRGTVKRYFAKLDEPNFKAPMKGYTDDTAMTNSVAKCLIEKPAVDYKYMAKLFVQSYFLEPKRGYGENVVEVFNKLRASKFEDIFKPAMEQFNGTGSYGNGGAMRIAPIALYFHDNYDAMVEAARTSTKITHTNKLGINGAILQSIAIHQSLHLNPKEPFDPHKFTDNLIEKMKKVEVDEAGIHDVGDDTPYQTQLKLVKQLLSCDDPKNPISEEEIIGSLGNTVQALYSVPTAIYCFLKAHSGFPEIKCDNVFQRSIQYAITLGGDCDTIGAMTGAIMGAYYGEDEISKNLLKHCSYYKETVKLADGLFEASKN